MSADRQLIQQKKMAWEKFHAALENNSDSFLPKLREYYFSYLMASWGLPTNDRRLLSGVFILKLKKDIDKFCTKHCVSFDSSQFQFISSLLIDEEQALNADIFVRRLFLDYLNSHKNFITRLFYIFPDTEHQKMLISNLEYPGKQISEEEKKEIIAASKKIKEEFIQDIYSYAHTHNSEITYMQLILGLLVFLFNKYFLGPLLIQYVAPLIEDNHKNDWSTFVFKIFIGLTTAFLSINLVIKNLQAYEETRRWSNFNDPDKLPDEFKNFLLGQTKEIKEKLLSPEQETPKTSQQISHKTLSTHSSDSYNSSENVSYTPTTSRSRPPKISKKITSSAQSFFQTTPITPIPKVIRPKAVIIKWHYMAQEVTYNSTIRRYTIKLWNYSNAKLSDFIYWESEKIKNALKNNTLYKTAAIAAWDGHIGNNLVKDKKDAYKLRIFGPSGGDPRLKFTKVTTSINPITKQTAHLYAFQNFKPKHNSVKARR